jgi:hypothetical protein
MLPHGYRARAYGVMQTGMQLSQFARVMHRRCSPTSFRLPLVVGLWSVGRPCCAAGSRLAERRQFDAATEAPPPPAAGRARRRAADPSADHAAATPGEPRRPHDPATRDERHTRAP